MRYIKHLLVLPIINTADMHLRMHLEGLLLGSSMQLHLGPARQPQPLTTTQPRPATMYVHSNTMGVGSTA